MKLRIERSVLTTLLSMASVGLSNKPVSAILGDLLIKADADKQTLTITAFDLSIGIEVEGECAVETSGTVAVPGRLLINLITEIADGLLCLKEAKKRVEITHPHGKSGLQTLDHTEFPSLPCPKGDKLPFKVEGLLKALRATIGSAAKATGREILEGVHIVIAEHTWDAVATDGHRLSLVEIPLAGESGKNTGTEFTLPRASVTEIEKILNRCDKEDSIHLEVDAGLAAFACTTDIGRVKLSTRLIGGAYPSIRTAIPSEVTYRFEMDRKELIQSVKRAGLLWDSGVKLVTLQFDESQANVTVTASSDLGDTTEALPISWKSGSDAFKVALNGVLFMESLKQISTNRISIDGTTKDKPIILRPVDSEIDHLVLLMPLAVLGR